MKRGEKRANPAASQQAVAKTQIEKHSDGKTSLQHQMFYINKLS